MDQELNVLALVKGDHRYVFVYDDQAQPNLASLLHEWAVDPRLNFNLFDAALLSQKSREQIEAFGEPCARGTLTSLDQ